MNEKLEQYRSITTAIELGLISFETGIEMLKQMKDPHNLLENITRCWSGFTIISNPDLLEEGICNPRDSQCPPPASAEAKLQFSAGRWYFFFS